MAPEEYIEKIKQMVADGQLAKDVAEKYFPELIKKVSEDERVLNEIIEYLKALRTTAFSLNQSYLFLEEWIAWLEKQAEQKPVKWSEEDDKERKHIIGLLEGWMNTFKETIYKKDCKEGIDWLKSLRPQSHWKPSDKQIEALESATANCAYSEYQDCLTDLIRQLKAL